MNIGASPIGAILEQANTFEGAITVPRLNLMTGDRFIQVAERTDPPAPPANTVIFYCRDNGAGKTQLVARFATGPIRVLATQA